MLVELFIILDAFSCSPHSFQALPYVGHSTMVASAPCASCGCINSSIPYYFIRYWCSQLKLDGYGCCLVGRVRFTFNSSLFQAFVGSCSKSVGNVDGQYLRKPG